MEKITGVAATQSLTLKKQGDLLYHEGPLLSHFVDEHDAKSHYLYKWTDCDELVNRWLIAAVPENMLLDYLSKTISLWQLIRYSTQLFIVDINADLIETARLECTFENVPRAYLPGENSFYNERKCEPYAQQLKESILAGRQLDYSLVAEWLDGNQLRWSDWPGEELSTLSHEIFDTLLSGYSKKKVYDFFARHYSVQLPLLPIDNDPLRTIDASFVSKNFVIFVQLKHHAGADWPGWHRAVSVLRQYRNKNSHLRDLDAVLFRRTQESSSDTTQANDITTLLRRYVYDQYQSALEEDDLVSNS